MAARVSRKRDDQNLRVRARKWSHRLEAHPLIPVDVMRMPLRAVLEKVLHHARLFLEARALDRVHLGTPDVELGVRKVGKAARVVDVEVGRNEVPYIRDAETERLDLPNSRLAFVELGTDE